MKCKAICNLSEYPIEYVDTKKQLKRSYRNSLELADYLIDDTFEVIYEGNSFMLVKSLHYAKEVYLVSQSEKQCFEFD